MPTATVTVSNNSVCQGASSPVISFIGANGTRPYTFTYRDYAGVEKTAVAPTNSDIATVSVPTSTAGDFTYELLRVNDANTCEQDQSETVTVTVNPLPTATISGTTDVCQGDPAPVVTFTGSSGLAPYTFTYKYNNGANQQIVSDGSGVAAISQPTAASGTFTYTLISVSGANNCVSSQLGTVRVTVNPAPDATISANMTEVCQNTAPPMVRNNFV